MMDSDLDVDGVAAFFYGTLMHPKILKQVIQNSGSHLQICPAILLEYTRHKVQYADYPGIVPYLKGKSLFSRDLEPAEKSVRGTLVIGLARQDVELLDIFEGDEYARERVLVHPLNSPTSLSESHLADDSTVPAAPHVPPFSDLASPVEALAYVYRDMSGLNAELWSFDEFVKNNAWKWIADTDPTI